MSDMVQVKGGGGGGGGWGPQPWLADIVGIQVLAGVEGILYAITVDGATTTLDFLEFFGEALNNFLPNGEPQQVAKIVETLHLFEAL